MEKIEEKGMKIEEEVKKGEKQLRQPVVHSRVRKIKQEDEKIKDQLQLPPAFETRRRPVFRDLARQQLSQSPLGRVGRAISVGD